MSKEYDKNERYRNEYSREIGEVKIADDVVAAIAALAASEVEGIAAISGSMTKEIVTKRGMKNLSRGIRIHVEDGKVRVEASITMEYGYSIPKTCAQVQERVKSAIENMTGLEVSEVNIRIVGLRIQKGN